MLEKLGSAIDNPLKPPFFSDQGHLWNLELELSNDAMMSPQLDKKLSNVSSIVYGMRGAS
jgi:hypothetical protein